VGCLYVLLGRGSVYFPNSDKAHPSTLVRVDMTSNNPIRSGDRSYFPFYVGWEIWHKVVVPVLKNPPNEVWTNQEPYLKNYQNWQAISIGDFETLLSVLNAALKRGLIREGFLPNESGVDSNEPVEVVSDPTPIVECWPDGREKLIYPKVE
jgi:hypothetical protein